MTPLALSPRQVGGGSNAAAVLSKASELRHSTRYSPRVRGWNRYAVQFGDGTELTRLLLRHGASVEAAASDGLTPLHVASMHGKLAQVCDVPGTLRCDNDAAEMQLECSTTVPKLTVSAANPGGGAG